MLCQINCLFNWKIKGKMGYWGLFLRHAQFKQMRNCFSWTNIMSMQIALELILLRIYTYCSSIPTFVNVFVNILPSLNWTANLYINMGIIEERQVGAVWYNSTIGNPHFNSTNRSMNRNGKGPACILSLVCSTSRYPVQTCRDRLFKINF